MIEDQDLIFKKVGVFLNSGVMVHINLKNGLFRRGVIIEGCADFLVMQERVLGEQTIFYSEIASINQMWASTRGVNDRTNS